MQEKDTIVSVPFSVYEGERARAERLLKDERDRHEKERKDERAKWFIVVLVLLLLCFGSNAAWLAHESQYEDISVEQEVDTGNGDAYVTGVGDAHYGESQTENQNP